jgi:hypothetical protein
MEVASGPKRHVALGQTTRIGEATRAVRLEEFVLGWDPNMLERSLFLSAPNGLPKASQPRKNNRSTIEKH